MAADVGEASDGASNRLKLASDMVGLCRHMQKASGQHNITHEGNMTGTGRGGFETYHSRLATSHGELVRVARDAGSSCKQEKRQRYQTHGTEEKRNGERVRRHTCESSDKSFGEHLGRRVVNKGGLAGRVCWDRAWRRIEKSDLAQVGKAVEGNG